MFVHVAHDLLITISRYSLWRWSFSCLMLLWFYPWSQKLLAMWTIVPITLQFYSCIHPREVLTLIRKETCTKIFFIASRVWKATWVSPPEWRNGEMCTPTYGSAGRSKSVTVHGAACTRLRTMVLREMPKKLVIYMHNTTCRIKMHAHQTLENMWTCIRMAAYGAP